MKKNIHLNPNVAPVGTQTHTLFAKPVYQIRSFFFFKPMCVCHNFNNQKHPHPNSEFLQENNPLPKLQVQIMI